MKLISGLAVAGLYAGPTVVKAAMDDQQLIELIVSWGVELTTNADGHYTIEYDDRDLWRETIKQIRQDAGLNLPNELTQDHWEDFVTEQKETGELNVIDQLLKSAENPDPGDGVEIESEYGVTCGVIDPLRSVGGSEIDASSAPWSALFSYQGLDDSYYYCGSTIIGKYHLLTSAYCCSQVNTIGMAGVFLGETDIMNFQYENADMAKWFPLDSMHIHDNYNAEKMTDDICIIKLLDQMVPGPNIFPACLPSVSQCVAEGTTHHIAGYDYDNSEKTHPHLRQVTLPLEKFSDCEWIYKNVETNKPFVNERQLCAGGEDQVAVCNGDKGAGLTVADDNDVHSITGVFSYHGGNCGQRLYPGVFARVTEYLGWINEKTGIRTKIDSGNSLDATATCRDKSNSFHPSSVMVSKAIAPHTPLSGAVEDADHHIQARVGGMCIIKQYPRKGFHDKTPLTTNNCPDNLVGEWTHEIGTTDRIVASGYNEYCWTWMRKFGHRVVLRECGPKENQKWAYDLETGSIYVKNGNPRKVVHYGFGKRLRGSNIRVRPVVMRSFGDGSSVTDGNNDIRLGYNLGKYLTSDPSELSVGYCVRTTQFLNGKNVFIVLCDNGAFIGQWFFDDATGYMHSYDPGQPNHMKFCWQAPQLNKKKSIIKLRTCSSIDNSNKHKFQFHYDSATGYIQYAAKKSMCVMEDTKQVKRRMFVRPCTFYHRFD